MLRLETCGQAIWLEILSRYDVLHGVKYEADYDLALCYGCISSISSNARADALDRHHYYWDRGQVRWGDFFSTSAELNRSAPARTYIMAGRQCVRHSCADRLALSVPGQPTAARSQSAACSGCPAERSVCI
jgi:hypothetical protein